MSMDDTSPHQKKTMDDSISTLPNEILCSILSLLPTKQVVSTSVLSKRWKHLWRSVRPVCTLNLEDYTYRKSNYFRFLHSAEKILRDKNKPLQSFRLRCRSDRCEPAIVKEWLTTAAQRQVEDVHLSMSSMTWVFGLPSELLRSKTLAVLKLTELNVKLSCSARLPLLKTLHLNSVEFVKPTHFAGLLCGCPNLEDLVVKNVKFICDEDMIDIDEDDVDQIEVDIRRLPKLVRAHVLTHVVPFEVVDNVQFLGIDWIRRMFLGGYLPEFRNLVHIEFCYLDLDRASERLKMLQLLEHCPQLQVLVIDKKHLGLYPEKEADWSYPQSVPDCISSHLKTCCLKNYRGSNGEFQFAKYIMQNARHLQTMTICSDTTSNQQENHKMIEELSSCTMHSATCKLSLE